MNSQEERFRLLEQRHKLMVMDPTLKAAGLRVELGMYHGFNSETGAFWKSLDNIAAELGCEKRRITEGRKDLVDRGYLDRRRQRPPSKSGKGQWTWVYYPAVPEDRAWWVNGSPADRAETPACDFDDGIPF